MLTRMKKKVVLDLNAHNLCDLPLDVSSEWCPLQSLERTPASRVIFIHRDEFLSISFYQMYEGHVWCQVWQGMLLDSKRVLENGHQYQSRADKSVTLKSSPKPGLRWWKRITLSEKKMAHRNEYRILELLKIPSYTKA